MSVIENLPLLPPASLYQRFLAWCIDRVVLLPLSIGVFYIAISSKNLQFIILLMVVEALYKPITEKVYGATLGKRATNIRVVSQDGGGDISWNQSLMRFLPWAISFYVTIFVYIRYFEYPGFADVHDFGAFTKFMQAHPLSDNTLIGLLNSLPLFSMIWGVSDVLRRAIHDKLAGTVVIAVPKLEE
jgi:uncharacterized RDD family membrane protein YckC